MAFEAFGDEGGLFVGYRRAADVRGWHIAKREQMLCDPVTVLSGRLERADRFWLDRDRQVFSVRLRLGGHWWTWAEATVQSWDPFEAWLYGRPDWRVIHGAEPVRRS